MGDSTDGSMNSTKDFEIIEKKLEDVGNLMDGYNQLPVLLEEPTLYSQNKMMQVVIPEFLTQLKKLPLQLVLNESNHLKFKTSADIDLLEKGLSEMGLNYFHSYSGPCKRDYVVEVRDYHGLANIIAQLSYGVKKTEKQRSIIGTFLDIYVGK
jgi:hypothetical protein